MHTLVVAKNLNRFMKLKELQQIEVEFYRLNSIYTLQSHWDLESVCNQGINKSKCGNIHYYVIYRNLGIPSWQKVDKEVYELVCVLKQPRSLKELSLKDDFDLDNNLPYLIQKSWVTSL